MIFINNINYNPTSIFNDDKVSKNSTVYDTGKVKIFTDGEGGNIRLTSKSGNYHYEMDAYSDDHLRLYMGDNDTEVLSSVEIMAKSGILNANDFYCKSTGKKFSDFQNGVDKIYNKCIASGSTPISKTPDAICTAIDNIKNNSGKRKLSGLLMVKSEKIIRTSGITDYTLNKTTTAVQIDKAWFGSGCRNASMNYKYAINNNNISVSASESDFANYPFLYTIGIGCSLLASGINSIEKSGNCSTFNFKVDSLPSNLSINEIIVELTNTVIGSGESDKYITFSYSYNNKTKTITVTPSITIHINTNWIANIYKL